ncbi:MAG: hypothetical protein Q9M37_09015 [Desulfonauticus sp.]|nr:hypothetical protein [Desulfonauticus sp.]
MNTGTLKKVGLGVLVIGALVVGPMLGNSLARGGHGGHGRGGGGYGMSMNGGQGQGRGYYRNMNSQPYNSQNYNGNPIRQRQRLRDGSCLQQNGAGTGNQNKYQRKYRNRIQTNTQEQLPTSE